MMAVSLGFLGSASRASARSFGACPPAGAHVLLADSRALVYRTYTHPRDAQGFEEPEIQTRSCIYGGSIYGGMGSKFIWGEPEAPTELLSGIGNLSLRGFFLAYLETDSGGAGGRYAREGEEYREQWHVVVRDLRTGRVLRRAPTGIAPDHPKWVGSGPAQALVVDRSGVVAWIVKSATAEGSSQVHVLDGRGSRVLATGPAIDPYSLALAGSTLYWTQGGKPFSAPLN
ncbi:MAG TPA: hypothetical protein VGX72_05645 [Solirubrobacteraceae bacterium]|jgi:hypothetical protein|nr:hypothetical protein [Solirubrobacteraceae bacterium]